MGIEIVKAKIKDERLECSYTEAAAEGGRNEVEKKCKAKVHEDMKAAFKLLDIHVALLCEQLEIGELMSHAIEMDNELDLSKMYDMDADTMNLAKKITCGGYSIGGSDEHAGVTLIGRRELGNKKVLNLISPFQKYNDEHTPYDHSYTLERTIALCNHEVELYLLEGKAAPNEQLELDLK